MPGSISRYLIIAGVVILLLGGIVYLFEKAGMRPGNLPGDIRIERENATCVVALGTSILLSILFTLLLNLVARWLSR